MRHNVWSKLHFCIKFVKDVYCFTEYIYSESQYPACLPLFVITFQSRCGREWDIKVMYRGERDFLPRLFEPIFQILHGFRSWIFIDNFIHYAPKILHRVDIWGIRRGSMFFSVKFDTFFCIMPGWPWLRLLAPRLGRTSCDDWNWTIFACLLVHSRFYGKGQASLLSLICCWCSNRQLKSILGVKNVSQWDRRLSFRRIWFILNFF